jgi:Protein of unknown function (DUF3667)
LNSAVNDTAADHSTATEGARCQNCESALIGPFCHFCGQPVRGPIREFFSFIGDGTAELIRPDSKLMRTLALLFFKPGSLTSRYLDGKRVQFVKPVRLYLSLSLVLFLVLSIDLTMQDLQGKATPIIQFDEPKAKAKANAESDTSAVSPDRRDSSAVPPDRRDSSAVSPDRRDLSTVSPDRRDSPDVGINDTGVHFTHSGKPWDAKTNPMHYDSLPDWMNRWINNKLTHIDLAAKQIKQDPGRLTDKVLAALPTTMFFLLPFFALILKLFYFFKNRLYAEHLLVAVQSHSFMFLCFTLIGIMSIGARIWPIIDNATEIASAMIAAWIPIYLFWMQKTVYRQGWIMSVIKYFLVGMTYIFVLGFALVGAFISALSNY